MQAYLIHFSQPLVTSSGRKIQHYIGYTKGLACKRLTMHRSGTGAKILAYLNEQNIDYHIVRLWDGKGWDFERYLKSHRSHKSFCPVCNPDKFVKDEKIMKNFEKSRFVYSL